MESGNPNRQNLYEEELEELNKLKANCNLTDIWQTQNTLKINFTDEINILALKFRIDHFCVRNQAKRPFSIRSEIVPNNISDHHTISLSLKNNKNQRGP